MARATAMRWRWPDVGQGAHDLLLALSRRKVGLMHPQPFLDHARDRHARGQRAVGVLEHDLHVAAVRPHSLEAKAMDRLAKKYDRAVRGNEPQDRESECGFA